MTSIYTSLAIEKKRKLPMFSAVGPRLGHRPMLRTLFSAFHLGVQSVAVLPEFRRRGLFRDLMGRTLSFANDRVGPIILAIGTPSLYTPFGFRQVKEANGLAQQRTRPGYRSVVLGSGH
jgi:hypothetical protein